MLRFGEARISLTPPQGNEDVSRPSSGGVDRRRPLGYLPVLYLTAQEDAGGLST